VRKKSQLIFWEYFFCDETRKVCEITLIPYINLIQNFRKNYAERITEKELAKIE